MKEATANKLPGMSLKNEKTPGNSRPVLNRKEEVQMREDLDEFSKESCKRNQIYIYLSLFLLLFTVVTLIVIT